MGIYSMCFYYLLLGHLLGDFIFQTDIIATNKLKHWKWNLLHSTVVTICIAMFAFPFGTIVILFSLLSGVLHFYVDYYKPKISEKFRMPGFVYFVADQGIHILIILGISYFAVNNTGFTSFSWLWVKILLVAASVSSFSAVFNQFFLNMVFASEKEGFFNENEKQVGNLTRLILTFSLYLSLQLSQLLLLVAIAVFLIPVYSFRSKWSRWMSKKYFAAKIALDFFISILGFAFLVYA